MQERRLRLERALMGDLTRQQIDIFVPGSRDDPFDVEEWAEDLAWLLLPRGIELFPRQRWCNSVKTMSEYGLLGACHQLLERAGYLWIMALQGKDLPARVDMDMEEGSTDSDWELSPDEGSQAEEGEAAGQQVVPPDQEPHHGAEHLGKDWAEFNRRQRGGAKAFILSQPRYALVISSIVLGLSTHMLHVIENIGSQRYDMAQWYRMLNGESGVSRMVEAFKGRLGDSTVERARCLLNEQGPWHALPPGGRTWAMSSIAFTEISTMLCGLEQLQFRFWRTFPFRLVEVLLDPKEEVAKRILDVPLCLLDEFSRRFLNRFQTPARLLSRQARGVIASLASIVRLDIIRLECKNAQIKRLMRARASTHAAEFGSVSADFILQQQCILEQRLQQQQGGDQDKNTAMPIEKARKVRKKGKFKGRATGGGGTQRRVVSEFLQEARMPMQTKEQRRLAFQAANQHYRDVRDSGGLQWVGFRKEGRAGTVSHRRTGHAFGGRRKQHQVLHAYGRKRKQHQHQPQLDRAAVEEAIVLHGHSEFAEAVAARQKRAQQEAEEAENHRSAIAAWSSDATPRLSQTPVIAGLPPSAIGAHALPCKQEALNISGVWWTPPGAELAARALAAEQTKLRGVLEAAWALRHQPLMHANLRPVRRRPGNPSKPTVCFDAGFCRCDGLGFCDTGIPEAFGKCMAPALKKGTSARKIYNCGQLVVKVVHVPQGDRPGPADAYLHMGFGNLRDKLYTFMLLEPAEDALQTAARAFVPGVVLLIAQPDGPDSGMVNMYTHFDGLSTDWDWDVELFRTSERKFPVIAPFRGGMVYVEGCAQRLPLWRRHRGVRFRDHRSQLRFPRSSSSSSQMQSVTVTPMWPSSSSACLLGLLHGIWGVDTCGFPLGVHVHFSVLWLSHRTCHHA